jgi:hypothetical protein
MQTFGQLSVGSKLTVINDFFNDNHSYPEYRINNIERVDNMLRIMLDEPSHRPIIIGADADSYFTKDPSREHSIFTPISNVEVFQKIFNIGYFKGADEAKRFIRQAMGIHINY